MSDETGIEITKKQRDLEDIAESVPFEEGWPSCLSKAVTGERFDILVSGGIKQEGCVTQVYVTPQEAVDAYKSAFGEYIKGKKGKIYWRAKPQIVTQRSNDLEITGYFVYSRILISENPMITYKEAYLEGF